MGVDTHVIIADVKEEDLIDLMSSISMSVQSSFEGAETFSEKQGYINFNFSGIERSMFCILKKKKYIFDYKGKQHTSLYSEEYPFLKGKIKNTYWWLNLGYNDFAVEIMSFICEVFGGWIDENDCDSIYWAKIKMKSEYKENLIRRVFKNDV